MFQKCSKQIQCFRSTLPHVCETQCLLKRPRVFVRDGRPGRSGQRRNPGVQSGAELWAASGVPHGPGLRAPLQSGSSKSHTAGSNTSCPEVWFLPFLAPTSCSVLHGNGRLNLSTNFAVIKCVKYSHTWLFHLWSGKLSLHRCQRVRNDRLQSATRKLLQSMYSIQCSGVKHWNSQQNTTLIY